MKRLKTTKKSTSAAEETVATVGLCLKNVGLQKNLVNTDTYLSCNKKDNDPLQRVWLPILQNLQKESHIVLQKHKCWL